MRRIPLAMLAFLAACTRTTTWSYPGGKEDGGPEGEQDEDGDGFTPSQGDCDDEDETIHPDAVEICDGLNNDCDAGIDEEATDSSLFYMDGDADGFGNDAATIHACNQPPGFIEVGGDCDDDSATAYPGAAEICNDAIDNNCNDDVTECALEGIFPLGESTARILGEAGGDRLGTEISGAGDIDGDGLDDIAIAAPKNDSRGSDSGAVYVFAGPISGTVSAGGARARLLGLSSAHSAGSAIAPMGDVDGDGFGDLIVGAERAKAGGNDAGEVYLLHGPLSGDVLLSDAYLRLIGEIEYDLAGGSVSGAGDVTGDGVADLLIGATGYGDGGFQNRGAAYLVSGALSGTVDLSTATARIMGEQRYDRLGSVVEGPGDVNGDGIGDVLASGYTWPNNDNIGAVFLFLGPVSGNLSTLDADAAYEGPAEEAQAGFALAAGDLDGDGQAELVVSAPYVTATDDEEGAVYIVNGPLGSSRALASADAVVHGGQRRDRIAASLAAGADVNRDGVGDLLIGAPEADTSEVDAGVAFLFYGPLEGTQTTLDAHLQMQAEVGRDAAGTAVDFAGDTNGDGLADILVGAVNHDSSAVDAGAAYLVIGTSW